MIYFYNIIYIIIILINDHTFPPLAVGGVGAAGASLLAVR